MIYILAAIGAITLIVLLWKGFGPTREYLEQPREQRNTTAPDDDPEFLRRIAEQQRKTGENDS